MQPDMWSGWGIRTLSADNPAYNPFSYQNGSVWPHDNGIIAMGFRRYGFVDEAAMIARDISEAASYFVFYRLPELYGGIRREPGSFPVQYLGANVPQAWAAGSVFHLLRAILGLEANAHTRTLYVDPVLPRWLPEVTLHNLRVAQQGHHRLARNTRPSASVPSRPRTPPSEPSARQARPSLSPPNWWFSFPVREFSHASQMALRLTELGSQEGLHKVPSQHRPMIYRPDR